MLLEYITHKPGVGGSNPPPATNYIKYKVIKKFLQKIFKKFSYSLFFKIYGTIEKSIDSGSDNRIKVEIVNAEKDLRYKVYKIVNGRLYTDRVHEINFKEQVDLFHKAECIVGLHGQDL